MKENSNKTESAALDVGHNDPFCRYKKLVCGSTNSQVEISESMRKWKEMKKNGFLTNIQMKATAIHKPQSRKKTDKETKKMIDKTKHELNKRISATDPTQLLSGLNPGIIKHVRNSRQVNSIIKAMLQNGEEAINKPLIPCRRRKEQLGDSGMSKCKLGGHESYNNKNTSECNPYSETTAPEQASKTTNADFSTNQEDIITSLSVKAADVALQWLKLIQHDINARWAAIRRSKKRVKNAIEKELPYLFSRDLQQNQENEALFGHSSFSTNCSQKENFNVHLARWKAVFTNMEVSLAESENQLKTWHRQVEELKSQCQEGLKHVSTKGFLHLDAAKDLRILKSQEVYEREFAVRAAAASIYSTGNMIMPFL